MDCVREGGGGKKDATRRKVLTSLTHVVRFWPQVLPPCNTYGPVVKAFGPGSKGPGFEPWLSQICLFSSMVFSDPKNTPTPPAHFPGPQLPLVKSVKHYGCGDIEFSLVMGLGPRPLS